jgi:hypothetical protein
MRFEGLLDRHERGELSQIEAAEMRGISERSFRRWRGRLREEGPEGLCDRRLGKPSSRRAAEALEPYTIYHWGAGRRVAVSRRTTGPESAGQSPNVLLVCH